MSWAANNPEAYDEILREGVKAKLIKMAHEQGYIDLGNDIDDESLEAIVLAIQVGNPKAFDALVSDSLAEVSDAESSHFTRGI